MTFPAFVSLLLPEPVFSKYLFLHLIDLFFYYEYKGNVNERKEIII